MASTSESIAQELHGELEALIRSVSQVEGAQPSAHETEERIWQGIRELGRGLMQLRFEACRAAEVVHDRIEVNGTSYEYERTSQRRYVCSAGKILDTGGRRDITSTCGGQRWPANRGSLLRNSNSRRW